MRNEHGGNIREFAEISGRREEDILDFSANINPLGPPGWLRAVINSKISSLAHYPDTECKALARAIAGRYGCGENEVMVGNGSSEILHLLPKILGAKRAVVPVPAYIDYAAASESAGLSVKKIFLGEDDGFVPDLKVIGSVLEERDVVFICQPNNPTGVMYDADGIRNLANENPGTFFIVDEAFIDFVDGADSLTRNRPGNLIVVLSFTKIYAVPGLRLGAAIGAAGVIDKLRAAQPCWSVNTIAQAVGEAALNDAAYLEETRKRVGELRERLRGEIASIPGLTVYPGKANYLLIRMDSGKIDARELARKALAHGIAVRVCDNYDGLDARFFRVAVRTQEDNSRLVRTLKNIMGFPAAPAAGRKTPALMFQATGSNAGKSILTAALCRILLQDGYRVAPFKSQNMSLNSFVTRDGGEMGRAQVVQAQACRLEPDVRMNPVLLKPNTDTGSQVIVNGKPVGNMNVREYIGFKPTAFKAAQEAYDSLASEFDAVMIEGAGSPAEVNLKHHDIVNMTMARHAGAPVLLVGDIDKGGVFASFIGTLDVLAEWERKLVAGFVINKFRGDKKLLDDAIEYTQKRTGVGVVGVVPFINQLGLPEEDSVSFKSGVLDDRRPPHESIEIAVIDLPHISNFTDFDPLRLEPDVRVKIIRSPGELADPDAVVLPGSKNVMGDIEHLRQNGFGERIKELAGNGKTEIVGICAGLQMLGEEISDPFKLESPSGKTVRGLGLLPVRNTLALDKTLKRAHATHLKSGLGVHGYEIHHGKMAEGAVEPCLRRDDGEVVGVSIGRGNVWGTYLHGVFDADEFRRWFIDTLRERRGLEPKKRICAVYDLESAFDRLAAVVRESLQINDLYRLMGLK